MSIKKGGQNDPRAVRPGRADSPISALMELTPVALEHRRISLAKGVISGKGFASTDESNAREGRSQKSRRIHFGPAGFFGLKIKGVMRLNQVLP